MKVATRPTATEQSFTTSFLVDQTPAEVFDAVTRVAEWWTAEIKGNSTHVGDVFSYRYEDIHASTQRVIEAIPGKRIVWEIVRARLSFTEDPAEWNGTRLVFDIARKGKKTELRFTHEGLVPSFECFEACSAGWTFYVETSLKELITTGLSTASPPWA